MTRYSDFQRDVLGEKPPIHKRAPLRYILDALGSLHARPEVDLQQVMTLIEEFPSIYRVALYLRQDQYFCRVRRAVCQEESYLWQYLIPDTIFARLQPYQYHSGQAYILPMSAVQDRIPALVPSLEIGNTQHPVDQSRQTIVLIPLITQASPLGFLTFSCMTYGQPDIDETIDLLTLFAQQLAVFLGHAQLQLELRRAHKERLVLNNVCYAILEPEASRDLQTVYQTIYTQLKTLMPIDFLAIERYDQPQGKIIQDFKVEYGEILALPEDRVLPPLFLKYLSQDKATLTLFSTVDEWHHLKKSMPELLDCIEKYLPIPSGRIPQSGITHVIKDVEEPIGILTALSYQEHSYTQQHLHILSEVGTRIAIAIKNASLYSELLRALKVAQESEQLKNQFLMTASHELRTPLTAVQGYIELLNTFSDTLPEETKKQFLNNAHRACEELVLLLGNVMDASRIDQDKVEMTLGSVHLIEAVHTIREIMEPLLIREARSIELHVPDALHVNADDLRLRQVLLNLVGNAFKYSHGSQVIAIYAESLTYDQLLQRFSAAQQASPLSADQAFSSEPSPEGVERWQRFLIGQPDFRPEQLRGAFLGEQQVGGYMIYEREMRMGTARIATGCIGIVVTHPEHRNQGVASALMRDAIQFAHDRHHALLLLDGIPKFYYRYGYTDMFDLSVVEVDRAAILAQTSSAYTVRSVSVEDAAALLKLYERQYGHYTGSFVRTLEQQTYRLVGSANADVVAIAPDGAVEGYLRGFEGNMAHEVAADNWEALLVLMQYHAYMFKENEAPPTTLRYRLPLYDRLMQWMLDHLETPDTSRWQHPAEEWVMRVESYHHRHAGWMGRIVNLPILMQAILPELQRRWQRGLAQWNGQVVLSISGELSVLHIDGRQVTLGDPVHVTSGVEAIQLTPQIFTQLVFGYRSAIQAVQVCNQDVSDELISVLSILFPTEHTWITRTDWF